MQNAPLIVERVFNHSADKIWHALTDGTQMKEWYFDLPGFKAEVGYEFEFMGGPEDGLQYLHKCKITEVIPGSKLAYSWIYDGYQGYSEVTFELFPEGGNTRLKLTHEGLDSFPADNKDFARNNFEAGWTAIINEFLVNFLSK